MVIKINYTSSDIYVSTNVSPVYVVVNYSAVNNGGGAVWGGITGTLSDQTDLQTALDGKFDDPTGTTSQYLRGDGSLATFPTIPSGTVTSVGLTMPSAFSVANSPITSSGTLAVTGAGTSAQYVRGDGQLANFPTSGGGGSSVNYYLNGSVNQGTFGGDTYYEMSKTPIIGTGTNFTRTNAQGNGYIASFITDAGDPALLNIPGGNWNLEFYFAASSSGSTPSFYAELYKVSSSNVFTLIASGSTNPEGITQGTVIDQYFTSIAVPQTSLLVTDRLAIRIFVTPSGRTITLHTEDNNLCEVLTTFSTGLNALNGLTSQVQYFATGTSGTDFAISSATDTHTFNLPTASATNRGALSSADWSTFSGKVGGSGATGQVAYWNGTNSQTGSNNLFWDAANARLGIGTNAPQSQLHLANTLSNVNTVMRFSCHVNAANIFDFRNADNTSQGALLSLGSSYVYATYLQNQINLIGGSGGIGLRVLNTAASSFIVYGGNASADFASKYLQLYGNTGNLVLQNGGTFTDGGQRLQVYGDAFIKGSGATSATNALLVQNSAGNTSFYIRNDRYTEVLGTFKLNALALLGNAQLYPSNDGGYVTSSSGAALRYETTFNSGVSSTFAFTYNLFSAETSTATNITHTSIFGNFAPTSGTKVFQYLNISGTINQTGGANGITRGLYVNPTLTDAADWRSIEWSNNSGWGLYGAGTAPSRLNGNLGLGVNPSAWASVNALQMGFVGSLASRSGGSGVYLSSNVYFIGDPGANAANARYIQTTTAGSYAVIGNNHYWFIAPSGTLNTTVTMTQAMTLTAAGRLLLGTTTEGTFLLDVNGTARVSGNVTISTGTTSQGTLISGGSATRYTSNTGINTSGIYTNSTATDQDVLAAYVSGGATSNLYLYVQSNGYIGTRGGMRLGAASGTDVVTQITNTWLNVAAGTTARSQINLASSTAPTSPNNGDIWFDGTDLKMRIGGVTKTFTLI